MISTQSLTSLTWTRSRILGTNSGLNLMDIMSHYHHIQEYGTFSLIISTDYPKLKSTQLVKSDESTAWGNTDTKTTHKRLGQLDLTRKNKVETYWKKGCVFLGGEGLGFFLLFCVFLIFCLFLKAKQHNQTFCIKTYYTVWLFYSF